MGRTAKFAFALVVLVATLSGCTRDQIENSILGGAKNWCRSQTTTCHVSGATP
jgi:hypothetical protein